MLHERRSISSDSAVLNAPSAAMKLLEKALQTG